MTVKVCVSVFATDVPELLLRVQQAERLTADIIEVRLDRLRSYHGLPKIAKSVNRPLIATNRPLAEKGSFDGSEADRLKILQQAIEEGFEYADLEITTEKLDKTIAALKEKGGKIILSHHDHFRTPGPSKLDATLSQLQKQNPDICKVVTTAQLATDNLSILSFLQKNHRNIAMVSFAMGKAGVWSRLMAPFYGAAFTYASLRKGLETSPQQPTIADLRRVYESLGLE